MFSMTQNSLYMLEKGKSTEYLRIPRPEGGPIDISEGNHCSLVKLLHKVFCPLSSFEKNCWLLVSPPFKKQWPSLLCKNQNLNETTKQRQCVSSKPTKSTIQPVSPWVRDAKASVAMAKGPTWQRVQPLSIQLVATVLASIQKFLSLRFGESMYYQRN